ncbi:MAG TPA: cyanoexosortase B system-associated protein [Nodosilinea sp.]|nr:cyanoexosortase B system-associated protein [Nodosilinea sp.]
MTTHPPAAASPLPRRWVRAVLVMALAALAAVGIVPAYLTGQWPWANTPQVAQIDQLRALETTGLPLPGWQLVTVDDIPINRQTWSLAEYQPAGADASVSRVAVLLHPQPWHSNQPQLEWVDLAGAQNWRLESLGRLQVAAAGATGPVTARWFRAWGDRQSFAVVQWYAMPTGGHPSPSRWFWANQRSQLTHRALTPWVAVSLLLPMAPLDTLDAYQPLAVELTALIQQQLTETVFSEVPN